MPNTCQSIFSGLTQFFRSTSLHSVLQADSNVIYNSALIYLVEYWGFRATRNNFEVQPCL